MSGFCVNENTNVEKIMKNYMKRKQYVKGDIKLNPKWRYDYIKLTQEVIKKNLN